jgi:hypothetical protein
MKLFCVPPRRTSEGEKIGTIAGTWAALFSIGFAAGHLQGQGRMKISMSDPISYRTVKVDGLSIFYREAGPKDGPTIFLLLKRYS